MISTVSGVPVAASTGSAPEPPSEALPSQKASATSSKVGKLVATQDAIPHLSFSLAHRSKRITAL